MANIQPSECGVFVQIWVDTNALQNGSTTGVYLVDSNHNNGSSLEGTVNLNTNVSTNTKVCWQVLNTNKNWNGELSIQNFSNSAVFGAGGTPTQVDQSTWTGQVQANGSDTYGVTFNAQPAGGTGISTTINPVLTVSNK
ncbi:hypothetical protein HWQ46_07955 [Shewanella sp. D64]|uniref:hypothetical protein n=1 Tax=unclassified Shewanella TaxID=196818 RepID=UPI0022BA5107|nr:MULTISPECIES: hypothetical protein [unclassified Shewanella]MEC4725477.1 hypothetical protein [Shewanella sp. D64]MEC4738704.1 hypothetical protein [Shewanella sp. E94]WBJ94999.1 hypothetical protein HWQ47_24740 [Shewanella sp. MTB7]